LPFYSQHLYARRKHGAKSQNATHRKKDCREKATRSTQTQAQLAKRLTQKSPTEKQDGTSDAM